MRNFNQPEWRAFTVAGILLSTGMHSAHAQSSSGAMISSSVRILCKAEDGTSSGSGFLVGKDGKFVLTNSHVISECTGPILVMSPRDEGDPKRAAGKVLWTSLKSVSMRHLDAAILELDQSVGRPGVTFAGKTTVDIGDPIVAVGYPAAADQVGNASSMFKPSVTKGNISSIKVAAAASGQNNGGAVLYQITAPIGPGNSGGPLFNASGAVIGINTLKALTQVVTMVDGKLQIERLPAVEGTSWALQIDELLPVLKEFNIDAPVRLERPNRFQEWINRDPVTAAAMGVFLMLMLTATGVLLWRRPATKIDPPPPGPGPGVQPPAPLPAQRRRKAHVEGLDGPYRGQRIPVSNEIIFGRDPKSCSVVFTADQEGIGRRHCSLRYDAARGDFELRDLNSANGTFAHGKRLESGTIKRLGDRDEFYLFKSQYRFAVRLDGARAPSPSPSDEPTSSIWKPN